VTIQTIPLFTLSPWGCEDLLQVKRLVLGGVKRTIKIIVAYEKKTIVIERRCNITFENF
jgi:hypothetical protein